MRSSLTDIRTAIKTTLAATGLNTYDTIPDVTQSPACVVSPAPKETINFSGAMQMGGDEYRFDLFILVAATDMKNAQRTLDQFITGQGPKSVREALYTGLVGIHDVDCMPESVRGYGGSPEVSGIKMIGAIMRVCVTVT